MQPYELIRKAAEIIETQGWACGTEPEVGGAVAARDRSGAAVRLFGNPSGGESRARVNPQAWSFSVYGALVKAQEAGQVASIGLMWDVLYRMAKELNAAAEGGTNYVHPVIQYNETEGRTKDEVLAFMESAAAAIEAQLNPVAP